MSHSNPSGAGGVEDIDEHFSIDNPWGDINQGSAANPSTLPPPAASHPAGCGVNGIEWRRPAHYPLLREPTGGLRINPPSMGRHRAGGNVTEEDYFFTEMSRIFDQESTFAGPLHDSHEAGPCCLAESNLLFGVDVEGTLPGAGKINTSLPAPSGDINQESSILLPFGKTLASGNSSESVSQTSGLSGHQVEMASHGLPSSLSGADHDESRMQCMQPTLRAASSELSGAMDGEKRNEVQLSMLINDLMSTATPELNQSKPPVYTGVVKHTRNKRWEAHLWIPSMRKQVYLGCYDNGVKAATAYDITVLCDRGKGASTNLPIDRYGQLLEFIDAEQPTVKEVLSLVRRSSNGFTRGSCKFRGVTKHPNGHWEARIGVAGNKNIYLGLHETEADAGRSYDRARVRMKGSSATTNFPISDYVEEAKEHDRWRKSAKITTRSMADKLYSQWVRFGGEDLLTALIQKKNEQGGSKQ